MNQKMNEKIDAMNEQMNEKMSIINEQYQKIASKLLIIQQEKS